MPTLGRKRHHCLRKEQEHECARKKVTATQHKTHKRTFQHDDGLVLKKPTYRYGRGHETDAIQNVWQAIAGRRELGVNKSATGMSINKAATAEVHAVLLVRFELVVSIT